MRTLRYRRTARLALVGLCCLSSVLLPCSSVAARHQDAAAIPAQAPLGGPQYPPPPLLGSAAILADAKTGRILYAAHADTPLPMASTTKIMTALLALEYGHLDAQVTVSYAAATIGQSTMGLYQGEQISLHELLYGLLLPSGNDAAIAVAEAVGGSEDAFVARMNERCRRLGCTHTHFTSPHGLDDSDHYASARDLLRIARAAMRYPLFRAIVRTRSYVVAATAYNREHDLYNVNQPLWWYPGVAGIKSGTTNAAGHCDVVYARRGTRQVIGVFLGMPDRYTDVRDLLDYGLQDFTWHSPTQAGTIYPLDDFSQDGPDRFLRGVDARGRYRYYVGTGHFVRAPFLYYYIDHPEIGLPTGEAGPYRDGVSQRFGATVLIYDPKTDTLTTSMMTHLHTGDPP